MRQIFTKNFWFLVRIGCQKSLRNKVTQVHIASLTLHEKDNLVQRLESRSRELAEEKDQVQNTFVPILATIEDRLLKLQQARKSRERLR